MLLKCALFFDFGNVLIVIFFVGCDHNFYRWKIQRRCPNSTYGPLLYLKAQWTKTKHGSLDFWDVKEILLINYILRDSILLHSFGSVGRRDPALYLRCMFLDYFRQSLTIFVLCTTSQKHFQHFFFAVALLLYFYCYLKALAVS